MSVETSAFWAFLLVFVRCSGLMLASPFLGAQNVPVKIRVLTAAAFAVCLSMVVRDKVPPVPQDMVSLVMAVGYEAAAGLIIGAFFNLILQAIQMAGSVSDMQMGLGSSQVLNPVSGVPVTVLSQFKYMLALVIFVSVDAHHAVFQAVAASYQGGGLTGASTYRSAADLLQTFSMLALQIAAPVAAVSFVVDAALGLINKAVPAMQVFFVGVPAKLAIGMTTLAVTLPALSVGVRSGVEHASSAVLKAFGAGN